VGSPADDSIIGQSTVFTPPQPSVGAASSDQLTGRSIDKKQVRTTMYKSLDFTNLAQLKKSRFKIENECQSLQNRVNLLREEERRA